MNEKLMRSESDLFLVKTLKLSEIKNEKTRAALKTMYATRKDATDATTRNNLRYLASLLNASYTQKRLVFLFSRRTFEKLIANDKNAKKQTFSNENFKAFSRFIMINGLLKCAQNATTNKAGIYKINVENEELRAFCESFGGDFDVDSALILQEAECRAYFAKSEENSEKEGDQKEAEKNQQIEEIHTSNSDHIYKHTHKHKHKPIHKVTAPQGEREGIVLERDSFANLDSNSNFSGIKEQIDTILSASSLFSEKIIKIIKNCQNFPDKLSEKQKKLINDCYSKTLKFFPELNINKPIIDEKNNNNEIDDENLHDAISEISFLIKTAGFGDKINNNQIHEILLELTRLKQHVDPRLAQDVYIDNVLDANAVPNHLATPIKSQFLEAARGL